MSILTTFTKWVNCRNAGFLLTTTGRSHSQIIRLYSQPAAASAQVNPLKEDEPIKSRLRKLQSEEILPFSAFLTDTFGREHNYLRISVTERCNLRCTYCMPEEGVPLTPTAKLLSSAEVVRVGRLFISQGVDKIRFTGGEPLIRKDLPSIIGQLSELNLKSIGITTNGLLLARHMNDLVASGVTHLNISLDTLIPKKFEKISRRPPSAWFKVWKGIEMAQLIGFQALKLNVVVMKGTNEDEICDFVELTKDRDLDVRFIEYMPFSGNKWDLVKMVSYKDMLTMIREKFPDIQKLEDSVNHTSKAYKIAGHQGKFGFITSMSDHFCGGCNRLRITANGNLKVCLFGNAEVSLRDAIRNGATDDELLSLIGQGVKRKHAKHAGMMNLAKMENRPMILIDQLEKQLHVAAKTRRLNINSRITLVTSPNFSPLFRLNEPIATRMNCHASFFHTSTIAKSGSSEEIPEATLSHVDSQGKVKMVDVSEKKITSREAIAEGRVKLSDIAFKAVSENKLKKGDVLTVAQIAGILGAKQTSNLIPLCHPLPLSRVDIQLFLEPETNTIRITSLAKTTSNTGVEMEALTAVAIAGLTIYDMCKAVDKAIIIQDIRLLKKTGGKSDFER